ncbi:hypothetical protein D3C84_914860 [compost metagenome]
MQEAKGQEQRVDALLLDEGSRLTVNPQQLQEQALLIQCGLQARVRMPTRSTRLVQFIVDKT